LGVARIELPLWVMVLAGWLLMSQRDRGPALRTLITTAAIAWVAEQTLLRAHGYHFYSAGWWIVLGAVPLVLPLWWALAITTAVEVTREASNPRRAAALAALLVLADAALVQPWLVTVGGCRWNGDGPFGVAAVGLLGPAILAYAVAPILRHAARRSWQSLTVDGFSAVGTVHLGVLATWHLGLKFTETQWPPAALVVTGVAIAGLATTILLTRPGPARRVFATTRSLWLGPVFGGLAGAGASVAQWVWSAALSLPSLSARTRAGSSESGNSK
jgi:hypothetical protein